MSAPNISLPVWLSTTTLRLHLTDVATRAEKSTVQRSSRWRRFFSPDLVFSAHSLLRLALLERKEGVWRDTNNHYTAHATSVIVLIVTAIDAWVMEYILDRGFRDRPLLQVAHLPLFDRVGRFADASHASELLTELRLLTDVRDEIVHVLPRAVGRHYALPAWLQSLDDRGLMINAGGADFTMQQKLASYAPAYWCAVVAHRCTAALLAVAPESTPSAAKWTAGNFEGYAGIASPERLPAFDAIYEFDLTPKSRD